MKLHKTSLLIALLFVLTIKVSAQESDNLSKVNFYAEIGPVIYGTPFSVNLETPIKRFDRSQLLVRGGFGYGGVFFGSTGWGGLSTLTLLTGSGNHHFETVGGLFLGDDEFDGLFGLAIFDLGYRYQKPEGGFIFRGKIGVVGIGISLGYSF